MDVEDARRAVWPFDYARGMFQRIQDSPAFSFFERHGFVRARRAIGNVLSWCPILYLDMSLQRYTGGQNGATVYHVPQLAHVAGP